MKPPISSALPLLKPRSQSALKNALGEVRSLASLAAPLVAGLVLSTSVALVDTAMLGPLGALPLAAVSLTLSMVIIFYAALYGFSGPVGLFAGRAFGESNAAGIGHVGRHGFVLSVAGGLLGTAFMALLVLTLPYLGQPPEVLAVITPYWLCIAASLLPFTVALTAKALLDATDQPWLGVALTAVTVLLNILLNWVLIYGKWGFPALGLTGSGLASLVAQSFGAALMWIYVRWSPRFRSWWIKTPWQRAEFARQWREALPMTVQYFMEGAAVAAAGLLIGLFGTIALAGNQIALSVGSTLYMLPLGMSAAVSIRIAQTIGAGQTQRIGPIGHAGLGLVTLWMALTALTFLLAGEAIARQFVNDEAVIAAAAGIFFVFGFTQLMDGIQSVSLGALRGLLDNDWPTRVSLIAYWLIALPLAAVLGVGLGFGAPGVWAGFAVGLAFASVALLTRFQGHLRRGFPGLPAATSH